MTISIFGSGPISTQELNNQETQVSEDSVPQEDDSNAVMNSMEAEESAPPPEDSGSDSMSLSDMPGFYEETGLSEGDPVTEEELENLDEREAFETVNKEIGEITIEEARRSTEEPEEVVETFPEADVGRLESMGRSFADGSEITKGLELEPSEKPYVVAILARSIKNNYAQKCVLFIRKFISDRGVAEKYTILRKRLFYENEYKEIFSFEGSPPKFPMEYDEYLDSLLLAKEKLFVFEDEDIQSNEVYSYRIKVKWSLVDEKSLSPEIETAIREAVPEEFKDKIGDLFG